MHICKSYILAPYISNSHETYTYSHLCHDSSTYNIPHTCKRLFFFVAMKQESLRLAHKHTHTNTHTPAYGCLHTNTHSLHIFNQQWESRVRTLYLHQQRTATRCTLQHPATRCNKCAFWSAMTQSSSRTRALQFVIYIYMPANEAYYSTNLRDQARYGNGCHLRFMDSGSFSIR